MANKDKGEVDLKVGPQIYVLVLSFNALAEIETLLDLSFQEIINLVRNPADFRVGTWRVLLWGALREHHKGSLEEAGEVMRLAGIAAVVEKVGEALTLGLPEAPEGEAPKNPRKASRNRAGNPS